MSRDLTKSFLADICEHPDDDAPRLIFADWLEDHGKPERAEFIRVQIERTRLPWWDARQVTLALREKELLEQHEKAWRKGLLKIKGVRWEGFSRGFVSAVEFDNYSLLRANASAVCSAAPVQYVSICWPKKSEKVASIPPIAGLRGLIIVEMLFAGDAIARLADAPLLSTLTSLELPECNLGAEGFERLLASPHLAHLTALRSPRNSLGNTGIAALVQSKSLSKLAELDLSETGAYGRYGEDPIIEAEGAQTLAKWPGLANLRKLALNGNDVRKKGLSALLKSPHARNLKELYVRDNGLRTTAMDVFASANREMRLDVLDVCENELEDRAALGLAKASAALSELKVLRIERCGLTDEGACILAKAAFFDSLRRLAVSSNDIGTNGVTALLDSNPPHLHTLAMADLGLNDKAAEALADSPATNTLLEIDLSSNGFRGPGIERLAETKQFQNLRVLRLRYNLYGLPSNLADSPLGQRLACLDVEGGGIDPADTDIPF